MSSHSPAASVPKRSNESVTASGLGKKKSARSNSDAPSKSSTKEHGQRFFDSNYRSVLHHPVGLPLVAAFHGKVLSDLPSYPVKAFPPEILANEKGNTILSDVYAPDRDEKSLTQGLKTPISNTFSDQFGVETETRIHREGRNYKGRLDLVFLPKSTEGNGTDTPLCVVEVGKGRGGISSDEWWKKFDQGKSYLKLMQEETDGPCCFEKPLLLAIITFDDSSPSFVFQMGVLLCTPRNKEKDFRISLIWHDQHFSIEEAAKSFGFLLRILPHFQAQRNQCYEGECKYFSSNCIKAGDVVGGAGAGLLQDQLFMRWASKIICLITVCCFPSASCTADVCYCNCNFLQVVRIYDSRFRRSGRRPDVYVDPKCKDIIGGDVKIVLEIPGRVAAAPDDNDPYGLNKFFAESPDKRILVIAIPFRKGHHVAKHPGDFLPIIDHLEKLHEAGYVHGDIRAYNTLFQGSQGFLIDFDFGGKKCEQLFYPQGYNQLLPDGMRKGRGGMQIEVWHDWYALGWLIFVVHHIRKPVAKDEQQLWYLYLDCKDYWMALKTAPPKEKILELKDVLSKVQDRGWMIELGSTFLTSEESDTSGPGTKQGATGSPPKGPQT